MADFKPECACQSDRHVGLLLCCLVKLTSAVTCLPTQADFKSAAKSKVGNGLFRSSTSSSGTPLPDACIFVEVLATQPLHGEIWTTIASLCSIGCLL